MNEKSLEFKTIPASAFECEIITPEQITDKKAKQTISSWVEKQDSFWPKELDASFLTENLKSFYLAYWVLDASASSQWSASIGKDRHTQEVCWACKGTRGRHGKDVWGEDTFYECGVCKGTGIIKKTYTDWNMQSGNVSTSISGKARIVENKAAEVVFHCGKRDFSRDVSILSNTNSKNYQVLQPYSTKSADGKAIAKETIEKAIYSKARSNASSLGKVKNFQTAYVKIERLNVRTLLYPIYIGEYAYEDETHQIQIDGVTNKLFIQIPKSVRKKRLQKALKIAGIVISIIALIGLLVFGISSIVDAVRARKLEKVMESTSASIQKTPTSKKSIFGMKSTTAPTPTEITPSQSFSLELPMSVSSSFVDLNVVRKEHFGKSLGWESPAGTISNGTLKVEGEDWNGLKFPGTFTKGEGIIINFKYENDSTFEVFFDHGEFYTDPYRRFGIYIFHSSLAPNIWDGKDQQPTDAIEGNFGLNEGTWYSLLLAMDRDNEFVVTVWDPDNLSDFKEYTITKNSWDEVDWKMGLGANTGNVEFDDFMKITFDNFY